MKKITFAIITISLAWASMSFVSDSNKKVSKETIITTSIEVPKEVKGIIDNKCYGCHNSESKNTKGKKKLSFDKLNDLSVYKQIGKYEGIHETITKGEMPPKKFLAKYPNKALTAKEKEILLTWAKSKGDELTK